MALTEYKRKRHFQRTPEPEGKVAAKGGRSFTVQKHDATHLHYDFRLELDGVLKSWAVPKGPSLDPSIKRLAMHVEDHPVDYGTFEGTIPEGEYGGGTVMLWDHGTWEPLGDPAEDYRKGRLKFKLHGEKLRGGWMLLRTGGRSGSRDEERRWLLFKERDDEARPAEEGDILEDLPLSVSTSRDLEQIANGDSKPDRHVKNKSTVRKTPAKNVRQTTSRTPKTKSVKLPTRVDVQLATLSKEAPEGDEWFHEIKFDGYRIIARIDNGKIKLMTRNHNDWTARLAFLAEKLKDLPVKQAILDGEIVAVRADGTTDFQELQNAFRDRRLEALHYYVFDLLYLNGSDLTHLPLEERKRLLAEVLSSSKKNSPIHFSEHVHGNGAAFLKQGCKMKLEGIISKRRDGPYRPGRGYDWLKVKCMQTGEFVIGGYTDPTGSRSGFGALLIGYHDRAGDLVYAGKVGTGFDDRMLRELFQKLQPLNQDTSPFGDLKRGGRGTHWVEPKLVAQVTFADWTRDGRLRHPSFQGLREDKPASEITREKAVPLARVKAQTRKKRTSQHNEPKPENENADYDSRKQEFAGVRLTSPDKVLYPEQGITKLELANYYRSVADWILPHIADRPLVLVRCPEGREGACFFQKHPVVGTPKSLRKIPIREQKKMVQYVVADDVDALISLAQIGALEIHAWGSHGDKLEYPDRLIFDLDPDEKVDWSRVVESARQVRKFLQELGLESFVKTTGGKGLHLVVPIDRRHDWEEAKAFCKQVADAIVAADPDHYTANMAKAARSGKIFIDYLRNGRGATAIVPYSPRARADAPVSTPLTWKELSANITSNRFNIRNIARRLSSLKNDPWEGIESVRQSLTAPIKKLRSLSVS